MQKLIVFLVLSDKCTENQIKYNATYNCSKKQNKTKLSGNPIKHIQELYAENQKESR